MSINHFRHFASSYALPASVAAALVVRALASVVVPDQGVYLPDADSYRLSASALLTIGHTGNPYQMPLYPLMIAVVGNYQVVADIIISACTVWLIGLLSIEMFSGKTVSGVAAAISAVYPPFIFISVVGLSENLFIALVLAAFLQWYRGYFVLAAVFAVLATLTRPIFEPFGFLLVAVFSMAVHRFSLKQCVYRMGEFAVIYCVLMSPWWVANYEFYGRFVRLTAGGGTQLYIGNNPMNKTGGGVLGVDYSPEGFNQITNLADRDAAYREKAISFIRSNPMRFVKLATMKLWRVWRPWPINPEYRSWGSILLTSMSFIPVFVLAVFGAICSRRQWRTVSPVYIFVIGTTLINMVMVGTIRYRLPLEPLIIIMASAGILYLLRLSKRCALP